MPLLWSKTTPASTATSKRSTRKEKAEEENNNGAIGESVNNFVVSDSEEEEEDEDGSSVEEEENEESGSEEEEESSYEEDEESEEGSTDSEAEEEEEEEREMKEDMGREEVVEEEKKKLEMKPDHGDVKSQSHDEHEENDDEESDSASEYETHSTADNVEDEDEDEEHEEESVDEEEEDEESEENIQSFEERRSLLSLAAEHDRVDILKAVLHSWGQNGETDAVGNGESGKPSSSSSLPSSSSPSSNGRGNNYYDANSEEMVELLLNNRKKTMTVPNKDSNATDSATTITENGGNTIPSSLKTEPKTEEGKEAEVIAVFIPPLHIAISHGSTHATSCLLRIGADPSIRPQIPEGYVPPGNDDANRKANYWSKYNDLTAWEIAFGYDEEIEDSHEEDKGNDDEEEEETTRGWFGFGKKNNKAAKKKERNENASPSTVETNLKDGTTHTYPNTRKKIAKRHIKSPWNIPPSKLEGIRHAFTAEALRAIGSDEVCRLRQLIHSGMPGTIEIGNRDLLNWCIEMGAFECGKMLREKVVGSDDDHEADDHEEKKSKNGGERGEDKDESNEDKVDQSALLSAGSTTTAGRMDGIAPADAEQKRRSTLTTVPTRHDHDSITSLRNRLEENEALSSALSTCLDNLAEEVSVCHGLLLNGGSSAALVSHVRSLKSLRAQREEELEFWTTEWKNREEELMMFYEQYGYGDGRFDVVAGPATSAALVGVGDELTLDDDGFPSSKALTRDDFDGENDESKRRELLSQLAVSENKVRKLRASISDLAEENARNLEEVDKRGLSGGVKLARTLREELRSVEFALSRAKSGAAACRSRLGLIHSRLEHHHGQKSRGRAAATVGSRSRDESNSDEVESENVASDAMDPLESSDVPSREREEVVGVASSSNGSAEDSDIAGDDSAVIPSVEPVAVETPAQSTHVAGENERADSAAADERTDAEEDQSGPPQSRHDRSMPCVGEAISSSAEIAAGHSTSIALRHPGNQGLFPVDLWELICRIIGFGKEAVKKSTSGIRNEGANIMIV